MKKIVSILICSLLTVSTVLLPSCHEPEELIDELVLDRVLSPLNLTVKLEANVNATFTWTPFSSTEQYRLSIIKMEDESVYHEMLLLNDDPEASEMTYHIDELPGKTQFKVVLVGLNATTEESRPAERTFETGVEQLFLNDGVVADADVTATTAVMRWMPGVNVTHLDVDNNVGKVQLDAAAKAAGIYTLTGLQYGKTYTVKLCRDEAVRGECQFVASDKATVDVADKTATTLTVAWDAANTVTGLKVYQGDEEVKNINLTSADQSAHKYCITDLKALTDYTVKFFNDGVECGTLNVKTLGMATAWDFTTWSEISWTAATTVNGLTIMADSGKDMAIKADADFGVNYLDLRGKSTIASGGTAAPTQRALSFPVTGPGVVAIDCYANGTGRNFYAFIDKLGGSTAAVEAPVKDAKGKIFIPCAGFEGSATIYIWTDATINHVYSIEWYPGSEAPGQSATALDTPKVNVAPAEVTVGDATAVNFTWGAVENAATYDWRIKLTYNDDTSETLSGTVKAGSTLATSLPAATVARLKEGKFSLSVTAVPEGVYKYKPSLAGTAALTVLAAQLDTPTVTLNPAQVKVGSAEVVVATWPAVTDADSYVVTFNGGEPTTVSVPTYTIEATTVAALALGDYTLSVVAKSSTGRLDSEAGVATLTINDGSAPAGGTFTWDFADAGFDVIYNGIGTSNNSDFTGTWDGLTVTCGGKSMKCGTSGSYRFVQPGGAGSATNRFFSFVAPASGELTVVASNTGSAEDLTRMVTVNVNGTEEKLQGGYGSATPTECKFTITVSGETEVKIYPSGNGLRFYKIVYTY